jgi:hypothetical protein
VAVRAVRLTILLIAQEFSCFNFHLCF